MRRRKLLQRIGVSGVAAVGTTGVVSAETELRGNYLRTEIDGEMRTLTHEEFDAHPETRSLDDVKQQAPCAFECCECCSVYDCADDICDCIRECGSCSP